MTESSFKVPDTESLKSERKSSSLNKKEIAGKIADHIGTGRNAKDSFVWMTITWSFYIASGLSLLFFVRSFIFSAQDENLLSSIVDIWSLFVPIITLALGYAFGKGE